MTIEDSLAFGNGTLSDGSQAGSGDRNGYQLGGEHIAVNHAVRRSIAYDNGWSHASDGRLVVTFGGKQVTR